MNAEEEENNASGAAAPTRPDEAPPGAEGAGADDGPSPFKKRRIEEVRRFVSFAVSESSSIRFKSKKDPFFVGRGGGGSLPPPSPCSSATRLPGCRPARSVGFVSLGTQK